MIIGEALEKYNTLRPVPVDLDSALLADADKGCAHETEI
jgi:hypothetical protein